jgi:hypothetical protein
MLDAQRYKGATYRVDVHFTRGVLWAHLGLGILVIVLMLLHELFAWAGVMTGWYLVTMLLVAGMVSAVAVCRLALGTVFLSFTVTGIYFLGQVVPHLNPDASPLLPHAVLPFWLGLANIIYAAGSVLMLTNDKVRKACSIGFSLW